MQESTMQWVTLAIAVYGAVLGSLGFWYSQRRDKPKISLVPEISKTSTGKYRLLFRIVNSGLIDVRITETGFSYKRNGQRAVFQPSLPKNLEYPIKLSAGDAVAVYAPTSLPVERIKSLGMQYAYVAVGHGINIKAKNRALTYFLNNPLDLANDQEIEEGNASFSTIASSRGLPEHRRLEDG